MEDVHYYLCRRFGGGMEIFMEKTLRIHNVPILNYIDLRQQFDPIDLYTHLEQFYEFAEVHCLPLPILLSDRETGQKYKATYVTKEFWLRMIRTSGQFTDLSMEKIASQMIEDEIKAEHVSDDGCAERDEAVKKLKKELTDADIEEKWEYISSMLNDKTDVRKVLSLLAICEIAEIHPKQMDISVWKRTQKSADEYGEQDSGGKQALQNYIKNTSDIMYFTYEKDICLTASAYAYKYWYHDEDTLEKGKHIKTVRITATGSSNQYASVKIELYSFKSKALLQTITLKRDEFRYCNVSAGKIIQFLPIASISDDICLLRAPLDSSNITVQARQAEAWTLNIDHVSSFICGGDGQGFILIQNGKINSQFYKPAKDYFNKLRLEMIPLPVVEGMIQGKNYFFLLEDGSMFSNASKQNVVGPGTAVLNKMNRYPFPSMNSNTFREAALSQSLKSFVGIDTASGKNTIIFLGDERSFETKLQNEQIVIRL